MADREKDMNRENVRARDSRGQDEAVGDVRRQARGESQKKEAADRK